MHTFGELLRGFREREGLSQQQLADKIGVSRGTISNWGRTQTVPHTLKDRFVFEALTGALLLTEREANQLILAQLPEGYGLQESETASVTQSEAVRVERMHVEHLEAATTPTRRCTGFCRERGGRFSGKH